jgi:hypothetical protein
MTTSRTRVRRRDVDDEIARRLQETPTVRIRGVSKRRFAVLLDKSQREAEAEIKRRLEGPKGRPNP